MNHSKPYRIAYFLTLIFCVFLFMGMSAKKGEKPDFCKKLGSRSFVTFPNVSEIGDYLRIHPEGQFVLASNAQGHLIDLRETNATGDIVPRIIRTPLRNESYPTEGNWKFIVSPGSMDFYLTDDLIEKGTNATVPQVRDEATGGVGPFNDTEMSVPYYHSAAELPGGNERKATYRLSLWSSLRYRDYEVTFDDGGKPLSVKKGPIYKLCQNILGNLMQPILSKDGTEVGLRNIAWGVDATRIYKISGSNCKLTDDLGVPTSKVNFSYPKPGRKGKIAYSAITIVPTIREGSRPSQTYVNTAYLYDRDEKKATLLSEVPANMTQYSAAYPGFTKDGRIIYKEYLATSDRINRVGLAIVQTDPTKKRSKADLSQTPGAENYQCFAGNQNDYDHTLNSLGEIWKFACDVSSDDRTVDSETVALSLDSETCKSMVRSKFQAWTEKIDGSANTRITLDQLLAACEPPALPAPVPSEEDSGPENRGAN